MESFEDRVSALASRPGVLGPAPHWQAKLAWYPAAGAAPAQGVGAHHDSGWLTLLWADAPGLEARLADGRWVDVRAGGSAVAST